MKPERRLRERGYVLVVLAGTLLILIGFAALAVDVGYMYSSRASLQRAADAAALAGAYVYAQAPGAPNLWALVTDRATQTAVNNYDMGSPITSGEISFPRPADDLANYRCTVDIDHQERTFFGMALGWTGAMIRVRAVAEAARSATGATCVKPWFIPNSTMASAPSGLKDCEVLEWACVNNQVLVDVSVDPHRRNDPFALSQLGKAITIKPGSPKQALQPGQFYEIELPSAGPGGSDYRENIHCCLPNTTIQCADSYGLITGNKVGPTDQGTNDWIQQVPCNPSDPSLPIPLDQLDTWGGFVDNVPGGVPKYIPHDGRTEAFYDTSKQAAIAPIWDICGYPGFRPACDFPSGTTPVLTVVGFATIFIPAPPAGHGQDNVDAILVGVTGCDMAGTTEQTGPQGLPIRLVRTE